MNYKGILFFLGIYTLLVALLSIINIFYSIIKTAFILKKEKPNLIFGFGGYVSFNSHYFTTPWISEPGLLISNTWSLGTYNWRPSEDKFELMSNGVVEYAPPVLLTKLTSTTSTTPETAFKILYILDIEKDSPIFKTLFETKLLNVL